MKQNLPFSSEDLAAIGKGWLNGEITNEKVFISSLPLFTHRFLKSEASMSSFFYRGKTIVTILPTCSEFEKNSRSVSPLEPNEKKLDAKISWREIPFLPP